MDTNLIAAIVGVGAGAVGYWLTTFWVAPILQYRRLRLQVSADLIYYAQVVNANALNQEMQKLYRERVLANRRAAAELAAVILDLPLVYRWWLRFRKQSPARAAELLIGFSNTQEYELASRMESGIRSALGINVSNHSG